MPFDDQHPPYALSRRSFVGWCAALGFGSRLRGEAPAPESPYVPSFLHPNDRWVLLQNPQNHPEWWDAAMGQRIRLFQGIRGFGEEFEATGRRAWDGHPSRGEGWRGEAVVLDFEKETRQEETCDFDGPWLILLQALFRRGGDPVKAIRLKSENQLGPHPLLIGDEGAVLALAPSGRQALFLPRAIEGKSGPLQVLALPSGRVLARLPLGNATVHAAAFSQDGNQVLFHAGKALRLWTWRNGSPAVPLANQPPPISSTTLTRCGWRELRKGALGCILRAGERTWVTLEQPKGFTQGILPLGRVRIEAVGGTPLHPDLPYRGTTDLALSQDGTRLLARYGGDTVRTYDTATGRMTRLLTARLPNTHMLAFGPTAHHLLTARSTPDEGRLDGRHAIVWHRRGPILQRLAGDIKRPLRRPAHVPLLSTGNHGLHRCTAWDPSGDWLATGNDEGQIDVYPARSAVKPQDWKGLAESHLDSQKQWFLSLGPKHSRTPTKAPIRALAFHPERPELLALDRSGALHLWMFEGARPPRMWQAHPVRANGLAVSRNGIATAGQDGVSLWNEEGQRLAHFDTDGHEAVAVAFSPDGRLLTAGCLNGWVWLWEVPSGRLRWKIEAHGGWASAVAFHPNGSKLATGGEDERVRLWSPEEGRLLGEAVVISHALAWSRDGAWLACGGLDRVRLLHEDLRYEDNDANRLFLDWGWTCEG